MGNLIGPEMLKLGTHVSLDKSRFGIVIGIWDDGKTYRYDIRCGDGVLSEVPGWRVARL